MSEKDTAILYVLRDTKGSIWDCTDCKAIAWQKMHDMKEIRPTLDFEVYAVSDYTARVVYRK